jgi:hypothetical protein
MGWNWPLLSGSVRSWPVFFPGQNRVTIVSGGRQEPFSDLWGTLGLGHQWEPRIFGQAKFTFWTKPGSFWHLVELNNFFMKANRLVS